MNKHVWSFGRFSYLLVLTCGRITECFGEPTVLTNIPYKTVTFANMTDYDVKVSGIVRVIDAVIQGAGNRGQDQYAVKDVEIHEIIGSKSTKVVKIQEPSWSQPLTLRITALTDPNLYGNVQLISDNISVKIQTGGKNGLVGTVSSNKASTGPRRDKMALAH